MTLFICGIVSIILLIASIVTAIVLRKDLRKSVRVLSAGFFASIFVALAPCHVEENGYVFGVNLFDTICVMITQSSLTDSLAAIEEYRSQLSEAYGFYLTALYVLGPLSVASATLSFVKGFGTIVYRIKSAFYDSYIFSSVNERSMAVCQSVREINANAVILFALGEGADEVSDEAASLIEKIGGIVVRRTVKDVKHNLRHKRQYCLLDNVASNNISLGLALNDKYKDDKAALSSVELLIYSTDEMSQIVFYNTEHNVTIHLFREEEVIANDLIFNYPLYGGVVDSKLNVLLVGGGKINYEILKKVIWSGYLGKKVKTQINIVDKDASAIELRLKKECSALFPKCNLDLHFHSANVTDSTFASVLDQIDKPTYIVVALGDEKLNTDTCIFLRRHFGKTNGFPKLHMTVDTEDYASQLQLVKVCDWKVKEDRTFSKLSESEQSFDIKGFGSYASAYSHLNPTESDFGMLALACHVVKLNISHGGEIVYREQNETEKQFVDSLSYSYNQIFFFKNNADQLALSISYLLYSLGYSAKSFDYLEKVRANLDLSSVDDIPFALYLDPSYDFEGELNANINEMVALTTERYNRFMYTLGWTNMPIDEIKNKSTRDQLRLKYARIGDYDVKALEKLINEGEENKKDYRKNDIDEIMRLPTVLKLYDEIAQCKHSTLTDK